MAVYKCKMCGGDLHVEEGATTAECEFCGTLQTVPSADDEKKATLFNRANRLRRASEFDKAAGIYESIVADFPEEAEAYWGLVLCKYGIEYVDDPKTGKKKGGIKVHSVIHANEGVHCDVKFTSAATNDSFMLAPSHFQHDEIVALDRAYINYEKFEELTERNVVYVTKMKKNLKYEVLKDCMDMNTNGLMEYREQVVVFRKDDVNHIAPIITYVDIKKGKTPKLVSLLTNNFDMPMETIVAIYRRRWQIESLFKQIKQNFPLRYFYEESANAIKIQIWVTLIANLLLSLFQSALERRWSFSGLATMVRIVMMEYLNMDTCFNMPDADMKLMLENAAESPPDTSEY